MRGFKLRVDGKRGAATPSPSSHRHQAAAAAAPEGAPAPPTNAAARVRPMDGLRFAQQKKEGREFFWGAGEHRKPNEQRYLNADRRPERHTIFCCSPTQVLRVSNYLQSRKLRARRRASICGEKRARARPSACVEAQAARELVQKGATQVRFFASREAARLLWREGTRLTHGSSSRRRAPPVSLPQLSACGLAVKSCRKAA